MSVTRLQTVRLLLPFFLFSSIVAFSNISQAFATEAGTVTAVSGAVMLKRPGSSKQLQLSRGDSVLVGDEISSGSNSAVQVAFADDFFVNLMPGTEMRLNQFVFDQAADRRTARIKIISGTARIVLFRVRSRESAVFVETDNAMVTSGMLADFGITARSSETEVVALGRPVSIKHISRLIPGEVKVEVNQKSSVKDKQPPLQPEQLSREERKKYTMDVRRTL